MARQVTTGVGGPLTRRAVMTGFGVLGAGVLLGACGGGSRPVTVAAPVAQLGTTTRAAAAMRVLALDVDGGRRGLERVLASVADVSAAAPDGASVVTSVGAGLFDHRFGLDQRRPRRLEVMPGGLSGAEALDPGRCHGDVLLTVSGPDAAFVDDLAAGLVPAGAAVRWEERPTSAVDAEPRHGRTEVRNAFGFKDGSANLDPADPVHRARYVDVGADDGEPAWVVGGTFHVVRTIRMDVAAWEATGVAAQERAIGRRKADGAPLGGDGEADRVPYSFDPHGEQIPLDSHVRLANPQVPETAGSLLLRRSAGYERADGERGMLFACFNRDPAAQYLAVQERLRGEPLERFTTVVGGGFYLALPGDPARPGAPLLDGLLG